MKKMFWGILLAMVGLGSWILTILGAFLPASAALGVVFTLAAGLGQAAGYFLIMKGTDELPQGQSLYYAGMFSKALCAYSVAITVLNLLNLSLPSVVSTILYYITDMSSFFVMYFCVAGVGELERICRCNLYADKLNKCFGAWVVLRLLASLLSPYLYVLAMAAYVVMLVYFAKAAGGYGKRDGYTY